MSKRVVIFDTETTGLIKPSIMDIKKQPQIIELYMCKGIVHQDGTFDMEDELETYLKPEEEFDEKIITKITGISNLMVRDAPSFGSKFNEIAKFHIGVEAWVAHNCAFDSAMMANEISRIGKIIHFPFPIEHICTVQKSMYIEQRRMTLTNLYKHFFGHEFANAHRAKDDVMALKACFLELVKQGKITV